MNERAFFDAIRAKPFGGKLKTGQVDGLGKIVDEAERRKTPLRHLAYILATAYHETAHTMQPIREMGGEKYLRSKRYYPWVGEGLVQVTWQENHAKFGATKPGQMLTWPIALRAIFEGMTKGMFTGKSLNDYITSSKTDYVGARRIVNGTDKASLIAGYAESFERALSAAGYGKAPHVPTPTPKPAKKPASAQGGKASPSPAPEAETTPAASGGFWAWLFSFFRGK